MVNQHKDENHKSILYRLHVVYTRIADLLLKPLEHKTLLLKIGRVRIKLALSLYGRSPCLTLVPLLQCNVHYAILCHRKIKLLQHIINNIGAVSREQPVPSNTYIYLNPPAKFSLNLFNLKGITLNRLEIPFSHQAIENLHSPSVQKEESVFTGPVRSCCRSMIGSDRYNHKLKSSERERGRDENSNVLTLR